MVAWSSRGLSFHANPKEPLAHSGTHMRKSSRCRLFFFFFSSPTRPSRQCSSTYKTYSAWLSARVNLAFPLMKLAISRCGDRYQRFHKSCRALFSSLSNRLLMRRQRNQTSRQLYIYIYICIYTHTYTCRTMHVWQVSPATTPARLCLLPWYLVCFGAAAT